MHKSGRQENHTSKKRFRKTSIAPIIIISDFIAAELRRYKHIGKDFFVDAVNLGIGGECKIFICHTQYHL